MFLNFKFILNDLFLLISLLSSLCYTTFLQKYKKNVINEQKQLTLFYSTGIYFLNIICFYFIFIYSDECIFYIFNFSISNFLNISILNKLIIILFIINLILI